MTNAERTAAPQEVDPDDAQPLLAQQAVDPVTGMHPAGPLQDADADSDAAAAGANWGFAARWLAGALLIGGFAALIVWLT